MATLPSDEDVARKILHLFSHQDVSKLGSINRPKPGSVIENILHRGGVKNISPEGLFQGISYGVQQGWFKRLGSYKVELTELGFNEM